MVWFCLYNCKVMQLECIRYIKRSVLISNVPGIRSMPLYRSSRREIPRIRAQRSDSASLRANYRPLYTRSVAITSSKQDRDVVHERSTTHDVRAHSLLGQGQTIASIVIRLQGPSMSASASANHKGSHLHAKQNDRSIRFLVL